MTETSIPDDYFFDNDEDEENIHFKKDDLAPIEEVVALNLGADSSTPIKSPEELEKELEHFLEDDFFASDDFDEQDHETSESLLKKTENFIEISEEVSLSFSPWAYDAIINKTVKEMEDELKWDLVEFMTDASRGSLGYLLLTDLDEKTFRRIIKYIRQAFYRSRPRQSDMYLKKFHAIFVNEFHNLIIELLKDERFLKNPAD